ncbi:MAG: DUF5050 domain-containing protein [Eubacteriales bacterium]|nr:DUF5050 domain-containing protein [Eubacteriales bacterium]
MVCRICRRIKTATLVACILLFLAAPLSCASPKNTQIGNSSGNLLNSGLSVEHNGMIYFSNFSDEGKLYKMKPDGSELVKVSDTKGGFFNSYGEWLYFIDESGGIQKINQDGTGLELVRKEGSEYISLQGEQLYFIDGSGEASSATYRYIYRMNLDGSDIEALSDKSANMFCIDGDWIYFIETETAKLWRIATAGGESELLVDESVSLYCPYEDELFYTLSEDGTLWRFKEGEESLQLSEVKASALNVSDGWIYYGKTLDDKVGMELWKMQTDGSDNSSLKTPSPILINVCDDRIMTISVDFSSMGITQIFSATDGSNKQEFIYEQESTEPKPINHHQMDEDVVWNDISINVHWVYATNILPSKDPSFDSPIFDDVIDYSYLFVNLTATNSGSEDVEFGQFFGLTENIEDPYAAIVYCEIAELDGQQEGNFTSDRSDFTQNYVLPAGESRNLQCFSNLMTRDYPVYLLLLNVSQVEAAIELQPNMEYYVTGWEESMTIMNKAFPGSEIINPSGVAHILEGEKEEKMFYAFQVEGDWYFVERDSGDIYSGGPDQDYPEYEAVPKEKVIFP